MKMNNLITLVGVLILLGVSTGFVSVNLIMLDVFIQLAIPVLFTYIVAEKTGKQIE